MDLLDEYGEILHEPIPEPEPVPEKKFCHGSYTWCPENCPTPYAYLCPSAERQRPIPPPLEYVYEDWPFQGLLMKFRKRRK